MPKLATYVLGTAFIWGGVLLYLEPGEPCSDLLAFPIVAGVAVLGMYGVDVFNAIVNPPQAAILAVGRIADRVVPVNGEPAIRPMMILSLSFDHRVVDGARGAQFLETLVGLIEEPIRLIE